MSAANTPAEAAGPALRPGDLVITSPPVEAVGRVDRVLETSRGQRLVVERAYAPGTFVVLDGAGLTPSDAVAAAATGSSGDPGGGGFAAPGPRWVTSAARPAALLAGGVFRRVLGRLQPDPSATGAPAAALAPPAGDDDAIRDALDGILRADPLIAGGEIRLAVRHGVALLGGWVPTVAAKVQAYRLSRTAPGVWEAQASLASDEEIRLLVGRALRARPELAAGVSGLDVALGRVTVALLPDTPAALATGVLRAVRTVPGVRAAATRAHGATG